MVVLFFVVKQTKGDHGQYIECRHQNAVTTAATASAWLPPTDAAKGRLMMAKLLRKMHCSITPLRWITLLLRMAVNKPSAKVKKVMIMQ